MKLTWYLGAAFFLVLGFSVLYWGHWIGPLSHQITTIQSAAFSSLASSHSEDQAEKVALPHRWPKAMRASDEFALYRIALPPYPVNTVWAISISQYMPGTTISVDHQALDLTSQKDSFSAALFAELPLSSSPQTIEIRVPAHFGLWGGVGTIKAGPSHVLKGQVNTINLIRKVGQLCLISITLTLSLFALVAYSLRLNPTLLALAATAGGMCLRQILPITTGYWVGDDVVLALYLSSMTISGVGLFFIVQRGSGHSDNRLTFLILSFLFMIVWMQFDQVGEFEFRRTLNAVFFILLCALAWIRFGRTLLEQRQWLVLILLTSFTLRTSLAVQSALQNYGRFGFDDNERLFKLLPLSALIILMYGARLIYQSITKFESTKELVNQEIQAFKSEILQTKEQEKILAVNQASEVERMRWLHEIHDGLGSHLIAARFLADKATSLADLEIVKQSIDDGIEQLRELVESLSPEPSTLPELLGAMRYRISSRFESAGITLRWTVEPMIEAGDLTSIEALHVQRIAQEALTNILKHANASTVCVHIFTQGSLMILRIDDDGTGFYQNSGQQGNGLESMQARALAIGGEISWRNLAPGTRVELIMPNI